MTKRVAVWLLVLASVLPAQIPSMPVGQVVGTGAPAAACTPGQHYFQKDGARAQWDCAATNTWTLVPTAYNVTSFGAVCNGTDINTAVQAAITAGAKNILIPSGCKWVVPKVGGLATIPGNITYIGEDWETSLISSPTPASDPLYLGNRATVYGMRWFMTYCVDLGGYLATGCPIKQVTNTKTTAEAILSSPWEQVIWFTSDTAEHGVFGNIYTANADGMFIQVTDPNSRGLAGIRFWQKSAYAASSVTRTDRFTNAIGHLVSDDPAVSGGSMYNAFSQGTGGTMFQGDHNTSAFNGAFLTASMANGSGSFGGNFENYLVNGVPKWTIDSAGNVAMAGRVASYNGTATAGRGLASIQGMGDIVNQTGSIASGNLAASVPAGFYRVCMYIQIKTVAAGACTLSGDVGWTYNSVAKTRGMLGGFDAQIANNYNIATAYLKADAASNVTRSVTVAGAGCGVEVYDITFTLERVN